LVKAMVKGGRREIRRGNFSGGEFGLEKELVLRKGVWE